MRAWGFSHPSIYRVPDNRQEIILEMVDTAQPVGDSRDMTTNRSTVDGIAANLQVPNVQTEIIAIKNVDGVAPWTVEWVQENTQTTVSTSLTAELEMWSGAGMSPRQLRDVARVLWSLVDCGWYDRDCFPDSFLDVVI